MGAAMGCECDSGVGKGDRIAEEPTWDTIADGMYGHDGKGPTLLTAHGYQCDEKSYQECSQWGDQLYQEWHHWNDQSYQHGHWQQKWIDEWQYEGEKANWYGGEETAKPQLDLGRQDETCEFKVRLTKEDAGDSFGLRVNHGDNVAVVCKKYEKFEAWEMAISTVMVRLGDEIVSVNGQSGSSGFLIDSISRSSYSVELNMRRKVKFMLTLVRTEPLGLVLQHADDGSCEVAEIDPNGLIGKLGNDSELPPIFVGDIIAAVNQAEHLIAERIAALKVGEQANLIVIRPHPSWLIQ